MEAWDFTDKFFVDRTHAGNDWNAVRDRLRDDILAGRKNPGTATAEMLKLLQDKYTRIVPPDVYESLSKFDLVGAGVLLSPNKEGNLGVASAPAPRSEAAKLGIRKGDLVTAINGMRTDKMTSFDVIDFLSKLQDPTITFTIKGPEEGAEERDVELARSFQKVDNPVNYMVKDLGEHRVGYVRVREFNAVVTDRLREALADMKGQGADEFVLDLRGNGGGAFQSALGIAGLFMENKPIAYVVDGNGNKMGFTTKADVAVLGPEDPVVVWIDKGSASASEVLAGALHDDCRALLQGEKSFGKGLIQAVYGLSDGSGLIVTVARYQTPRGTDIQGLGIVPDEKGGLPPNFFAKPGWFEQAPFDTALERMRACPPLEDVATAAASSSSAPGPGAAAGGSTRPAGV